MLLALLCQDCKNFLNTLVPQNKIEIYLNHYHLETLGHQCNYYAKMSLDTALAPLSQCYICIFSWHRVNIFMNKDHKLLKGKTQAIYLMLKLTEDPPSLATLSLLISARMLSRATHYSLALQLFYYCVDGKLP